MKKHLHVGARWIFRVRVYFYLVILFFIFRFVVVVFAPTIINFTYTTVLSYVVFTVIFAEIYARMAYKRWLYEFTDRGLKTESGIITKIYSNVPYGRVQNVDLYRGVLARIFGFSTIYIQTAGYSGEGVAEGGILAVSIKDAEKIRAAIMRKVTKRK